MLNGILEDMGFAGLWKSCSFNLAQQEQDRACFGLTEKLIEVGSFTPHLPLAPRFLIYLDR